MNETLKNSFYSAIIYVSCHEHNWKGVQSQIVFATGQDSATFRDKGTEVSSLSRDKGTTGQA